MKCYANAKSLQSCPTLCDPIEGSPPGSAVPGILQARRLEWVAISFNAWKRKVKVKSLSRVWFLATPWTAAHQAPPSMGFFRQEYWSGMPLPFLVHYYVPDTVLGTWNTLANKTQRCRPFFTFASGTQVRPLVRKPGFHRLHGADKNKNIPNKLSSYSLMESNKCNRKKKEQFKGILMWQGGG